MLVQPAVAFPRKTLKNGGKVRTLKNGGNFFFFEMRV